MRYDEVLRQGRHGVPTLEAKMRDYILLRQIQVNDDMVDWEKARKEISELYRTYAEGRLESLSPETLDKHIEHCKQGIIRIIEDLFVDLNKYAKSSMELREYSDDDKDRMDGIEDRIYCLDMAEDLSDWERRVYHRLLDEKDAIIIRNKMVDECIRKV